MLRMASKSRGAQKSSEHACDGGDLLTRNRRHYERVDGLRLVDLGAT